MDIQGNTGQIAEGFTNEGTGGKYLIEDFTNYVFTGKPNSGTIQLLLPSTQTYLVEIHPLFDAEEFIKDNIAETINSKVGRNNNQFSGALYF
jgi:hypothetical protein